MMTIEPTHLGCDAAAALPKLDAGSGCSRDLLSVRDAIRLREERQVLLSRSRGWPFGKVSWAGNNISTKLKTSPRSGSLETSTTCRTGSVGLYRQATLFRLQLAFKSSPNQGESPAIEVPWARSPVRHDEAVNTKATQQTTEKDSRYAAVATVNPSTRSQSIAAYKITFQIHPILRRDLRSLIHPWHQHHANSRPRPSSSMCAPNATGRVARCTAKTRKAKRPKKSKRRRNDSAKSSVQRNAGMSIMFPSGL